MSLAQGRHASTPRRRRIGLTRDRLALNIKGAQKHVGGPSGNACDCHGGAAMAAGRAAPRLSSKCSTIRFAYRHSHTRSQLVTFSIF